VNRKKRIEKKRIELERPWRDNFGAFCGDEC